ncbi:hypothetical protein H0H87_011118 [Tephrocybe sp. NHM501043]|nr:hypothetical protein H0H87_011118 [Tephrocybe sp. NHM501043]
MDRPSLPALGGDFKLLNFEFGSPVSDDLSPLLATPVGPAPAHDTTRIESPYVPRAIRSHPSSPSPFRSGFARYTVESVINTPGAPVMKDLDSFTDGTGAGSFADFGDGDEEYTPSILVAHPIPYNATIQAWRMDVSASNAPLVPFADLPDDPQQMEALESAEALLEEFAINVEEEPEEVEDDYAYDTSFNGGIGTHTTPATPIILVPPMSAPVEMTPRVMKRARSSSPASQASRRARPRSLSSIGGGLPSDLTALPPWRSTYPFKD